MKYDTAILSNASSGVINCFLYDCRSIYLSGRPYLPNFWIIFYYKKALSIRQYDGLPRLLFKHVYFWSYGKLLTWECYTFVRLYKWIFCVTFLERSIRRSTSNFLTYPSYLSSKLEAFSKKLDQKYHSKVSIFFIYI